MLNRFYNSTSMFTGFSEVVVRLGTIAKLKNKTYETYLWALKLFDLMSYAHKEGPSWFLPLCKVARVLSNLLVTLAFRFYIVPAHLLGLYYNNVLAFDCFWLDLNAIVGDFLISPLYYSYLGYAMPSIGTPP